MKNLGRNITIFNLLFVPVLLLTDWIIISWIDTLPEKRATDSLFDYKDGYDFGVLIISFFIFLFWSFFCLFTIIRLKKHKVLARLNLFSLLWFPGFVVCMVVISGASDSFKSREFKNKVAELAPLRTTDTIHLPFKSDIIKTINHEGEFYILTGVRYTSNDLHEDYFYESTYLYFDSLNNRAMNVDSLRIFRLADDHLIEENLINHPAIDTSYLGTLYDYNYSDSIAEKDSLLFPFIVLKENKERSLFPYNYQGKTYLIDKGKQSTDLFFNKDFYIAHALQINERTHHDLSLNPNYNTTAIRMKCIYYSNHFFQISEGEFIAEVQPIARSSIKSRALLEVIHNDNGYYMFIGHYKNGGTNFYTLGPFDEYIQLHGIYSKDGKAYVAKNNKLLVFKLKG